MKTIFTIILSLVLMTTVKSQIYSTDFGATTTGTPPNPFNPTPTIIDANVTTTGWTGGNVFFTGVTGGAYCNSVANGNGTYSITLTVAPGFTLDISTVSFQMRRTATGPTVINVSVAGIPFTVAGSAPNGSFGSIVASGTATSLAGDVTVTITTSGATGAGQNNRLDNVTIAGSTVLPIKLESFTATSRTNIVNLDWKVSSEINISKYEVERSNNGTEFNSISTLTARNSANYSSVDNTPLSGFNYYRLKIIENDGRFSYSDIQKVKVDGKSLSINAVYPNPASDNITLSINNNSSTEAIIQIIDFNGRTVSTRKVTIQDGLTVKTFNVSDLTSGFYVLRIMTKDETTYEKFVKL